MDAESLLVRKHAAPALFYPITVYGNLGKKVFAIALGLYFIPVFMHGRQNETCATG